MLNWSMSITLGSGDRGREWDRVIRQQAKKKRMSIGQYIRFCIYSQVQRDSPDAAVQGPDVTEALENEPDKSVATGPSAQQ